MGLQDETLQLAVNFFDRFLSVQKVQADLLCNVAATCVLLASKIQMKESDEMGWFLGDHEPEGEDQSAKVCHDLHGYVRGILLRF